MENANLTKKLKEIRKFARFGLVKLSNHAKERMIERGLSSQMVYSMLTDNSNIIAQHNEKGYVIWAKYQKKYYHIVICDNTSPTGGKNYVVTTVYEPSKDLFKGNGRYLKKKTDRIPLQVYN